MLSKEEYDSLIETTYLLSDPDMAKDIEDAKKTPTEDMVTWHA
jgi:PHD/YefM family antitoxin component YafN of YafNO toxin-antitoxin module